MIFLGDGVMKFRNRKKNSVDWDLQNFSYFGGWNVLHFYRIALAFEYGLSYKKLANCNNGIPDFSQIHAANANSSARARMRAHTSAAGRRGSEARISPCRMTQFWYNSGPSWVYVLALNLVRYLDNWDLE